jgi:hypothetical protein
MKRLDSVTVLVLALGGVLAASGCVTREIHTDTFVSYEVIRAPEAPPANPVGAVLSAPSPAPAGATWMAPYWMWSGSAFTWMVGRWIPTLSGYAFLQPHWVLGPHGWTLVGGGWAGPDGRVVATPPPVATPSSGGHCEEQPQTSVAVGTPAPRTPPDGAVAPERDYARRTVTLSHHSYAPLRTHDEDDDDDAPPRAASSGTAYVPPREPTYRPTAPPTTAPSSTASSSAESSGSRTGYPSSSSGSSSASASASSGVSIGTGSRTGYTTGSGTISATRGPD